MPCTEWHKPVTQPDGTDPTLNATGVPNAQSLTDRITMLQQAQPWMEPNTTTTLASSATSNSELSSIGDGLRQQVASTWDGLTHYFDDPDTPIREQGGERRLVTIGEGAWIGTGAIVLADVGPGTIVAAGAVVTKPLPANVIAGGVPAKVIRLRFEDPTS